MARGPGRLGLVVAALLLGAAAASRSARTAVESRCGDDPAHGADGVAAGGPSSWARRRPLSSSSSSRAILRRPSSRPRLFFAVLASHGARGQLLDIINAGNAVDHLDADGDGQITKREFLRATCNRDIFGDPRVCTKKSREFFMELFEETDSNHDGILTQEEASFLVYAAKGALSRSAQKLVKALESLPENLASEREAADFITSICDNVEPGAVTLDEFTVAAGHLLADEFYDVDIDIIDWLPKVFRASDIDKSRTLGDDEVALLMTAAGAWRGEVEPSEWEWEVSGNSGNNEGYYYIDEIYVDGEAAPEVGNDAIDGTLEELDTNGDSRIDMREFMDAAREADPSTASLKRATMLFVEADVDADGYIERHELANLLAVAYAEHR